MKQAGKQQNSDPRVLGRLSLHDQSKMGLQYRPAGHRPKQAHQKALQRPYTPLKP